MANITTTQLRSNLYKILDKVLETGRPITVERKGQVLSIVPPQKRRKLDALKKHDCIVGDPEDLVHCDWTHEWKPKFV